MRTEVDQIECLSHEHHSHIMGHLPHATLRLRNICRQQPTLTHQNQKRCSILYREYRPNFTTRHSLQIRYEVKCTTDILKLSTPCLVAAYHFFLFQLNAHHTLKNIFITNYVLHVSLFVTPSLGRPLHYLLKSYMLVAMLLYNIKKQGNCTFYSNIAKSI